MTERPVSREPSPPPQAPRPAAVTLQTYLSTLIGVAMLPLVLLAVALAGYHVLDVKRELEAEGRRNAISLATSVDRGLHSRIRGLAMLAESAFLDEPARLGDFYALAQTYQHAYGSHVVLADIEQHMVLNTRVPWGAELPPLPRPKGRAAVPVALQTRQPAIGDIFIGPVSNTQLVALAMPVLRHERVQSVLLTVFDVSWFRPLVDDVALAPGWSMKLLDSSGQVIVSRGDPPDAQGGPAGYEYVAGLTAAPWRVVVSMPDNIHDATVLRMGLAMLAAVLLASLAGYLGARRASRRLAHDFFALAAVDAPPSVPPEDRQREIAEAAVARARLRDATARRELAERQREAAAADARRAHEVLQHTLARIDDGVLAFDRERRFTYANERAARLLGREAAAELVGRTLAEVVPEAEAAEWHAACAEALASGQASVREVFMAPSQRWLENRLYPAHDGVSVHIGDVTERRQADAALRDSRARLDAAMEAMGDAVYLSDTKGQLLQFNSAFVRFYRFADRADCPATLAEYQALLEVCDEHGVPVPANRWGVGRALHGEVGHDRIVRLRRKDTGERWTASFSYAPIRDAAGQVLGAVVTARDISERFEAERELREAQRVLVSHQMEMSDLTQRLLQQERETSRHVAQALHDQLGQSLAVARLRLDAVTVAHGPSMPPEMKGECTRIGEAIHQAVADVRRVLSELRPPMLEEQGLCAALDNEVRERDVVAGDVDVMLVVDGPTLAVRWPADVEYAAFMIAREAVAHAQQHAQASLVTVHVEGDGHWLRLAVSDDGIGIASPESPGRTRHLGLVGMRERALAISARLEVQAQPEGGSNVLLEWKDETV